MDFLPPEYEPPKVPPYATYVPGRRPQFKVHVALGHAKNAIMNNWHGGYSEVGGGIIYVLQNNEWLEVIRIEPRTDREVARAKLRQVK